MAESTNQNIILLVDDDPAILEGVADLLTLYGYEVLTAEHGLAALEVMKERPPDLVISDITMPEMDGYAFFDEVRRNPAWIPIPFIFLTARGQTKDIREGHRMGVDAYLTKPFEPEDLIVLVESRLNRVRMIQNVAQDDLDAIKNQLITVFSHELRTPLTYIYGYVNLLQEQHSELNSDEVDSMLDGVRRGAERLVRLVEDLMLMVRLDSGVVAMEVDMRQYPLSVRRIVNEAVTSKQGLIDTYGVELVTSLPEGLYVSGVNSYLMDAISRIVDNAIKFCRPTDGYVEIVAQANGNNQVTIEVLDNGPGFEPQAIEKAFDRLVQLERDQNEQQGLGLGLAISRELVRLHGGDITAKTHSESGSSFYITLPLTEHTPAERA